MSRALQLVLDDIGHRGYAFYASGRGQTVYLETNGWALRGGKWRRFRDGRTSCGEAITNVFTPLLPEPPAGARICPCCKEKG